MRAARDLFDIEGRNRVAQDVAHVGGVPIEAFEVFYHTVSIYDKRIYSKRKICASLTRSLPVSVKAWRKHWRKGWRNRWRKRRRNGGSNDVHRVPSEPQLPAGST